MPQELWRCFPWDPDARPGRRYSASWLAAGQQAGRFDLQDAPPVRYLAGTPEHALGEVLAPFRGTRFVPAYLIHSGLPLALVRVRLADALVARLADLTDPGHLLMHGLRPDTLAHHDRSLTQAVARRLHTGRPDQEPLAGLRWWSALTGAWHTTVVFTDRVRRGELRFGRPRRVTLDDPVTQAALAVLGVAT